MERKQKENACEGKERTIDELHKILREPREYSLDTIREEKIRILKGLLNEFMSVLMAWDQTASKPLARKSKLPVPKTRFKDYLQSHYLHAYADFVLIADDNAATRESLAEDLRKLLSINYNPPKPEQKDDALNQLECLLYYYSFLDQDAAEEVRKQMDIALLKLTLAVAQYVKSCYSAAERIDQCIDRTERAAQAKETKRLQSAQNVLEIAYRMDTTGMSKHKVARKIQRKLLKETGEDLSVRTITRYLEEEEKKRKEEGRPPLIG